MDYELVSAHLKPGAPWLMSSLHNLTHEWYRQVGQRHMGCRVHPGSVGLVRGVVFSRLTAGTTMNTKSF
jgi:hypothetical protein